MASSLISLICFLVVINLLICSSQAFKYYVGGKHGWSVKPSQNFNEWSSKNRFQVNDSLIFKYKNGTDSVLLVDQDDYDTCNKTKPVRTLDNKGDYSEFHFDNSGLFFFISGQADNCEKGQKVIILVMAPRNITHKAPPPALSPSPVAQSTPTITPAMSPSSNTPASVPSVAAFPSSPSPSPSPAPSPGGIASDEAKSGAPAFSDGSLKLLFCVLSTSVVLSSFNFLGGYY